MNKHSAAAPHHEHQQTPMLAYISNPFYAVFEGVKRLFSTNQTAAIIIMVISIVLAILQFAADLLRALLQAAGENSSNTSQKVLGASTDEFAWGALGITAVILIVLGIFIVAVIFNLVATVLWRGMLSYVALCSIKGEKASFSAGMSLIGKHFWALVVSHLVAQLKIIGGFLLFIVPGIRALYRYDMAFMYIFDKNVSGMQSLRDMKAITKGRIIEIFGVKTMAGFASIVPGGTEMANLGGQITQYQQLVSTYETRTIRPKVHWLNYLGFVIIGLVSLFVIGIGVLIVMIVLAEK